LASLKDKPRDASQIPSARMMREKDFSLEYMAEAETTCSPTREKLHHAANQA
jgi:hypothetical protein